MRHYPPYRKSWAPWFTAKAQRRRRRGRIEAKSLEIFKLQMGDIFGLFGED